jgi:hypothetical protein
VGNKAAANLQGDADLSAELGKAAKGSRYLNEGDLQAIASIESTANRQTGVNKFGYAGLFQMGPSAAKDVGYDYDKLKDPSNWKTNVAAGVKYLDLNADRLADKGVPVTALNVYMAHQQGATGAARILQAVGDGSAQTSPANKSMLANLPKSYKNAITGVGKQVTIQNYYDYWNAAYNAVNAAVNTPSD